MGTSVAMIDKHYGHVDQMAQERKSRILALQNHKGADVSKNISDDELHENAAVSLATYSLSPSSHPMSAQGHLSPYTQGVSYVRT